MESLAGSVAAVKHLKASFFNCYYNIKATLGAYFSLVNYTFEVFGPPTYFSNLCLIRRAVEMIWLALKEAKHAIKKRFLIEVTAVSFVARMDLRISVFKSCEPIAIFAQLSFIVMKFDSFLLAF